MKGVRGFLEALGGVSPHGSSEGRTGRTIADGADAVGIEGDAGTPGRVMLDIVEIHDAFGPTATEEDIQALVISDETRSGGDAVNALRREKGWGELDVWCIEVISGRRAGESSRLGGEDEGTSGASRDGQSAKVDNTSDRSVGDAVTADTQNSEISYSSASPESARSGAAIGSEGGIRTESLKGLDEKTLKEVKMGSTGIRAWLAAKAEKEGRETTSG